MKNIVKKYEKMCPIDRDLTKKKYPKKKNQIKIFLIYFFKNKMKKINQINKSGHLKPQIFKMLVSS